MVDAFRFAPLALLLGFVGGSAFAQSNVIDVTLEVLDDVSDIDAVVVKLEDVRKQEREQGDRVTDERGSDTLANEVPDVEADRENRERDAVADGDKPRAVGNAEENPGSDPGRTSETSGPDTADGAGATDTSR